MKKPVKPFLIAGIVVVMVVIAVLVWRSNRAPAVRSENSQPTAPSRMLKNGPVGDGIVSTKVVGDVTVKMEASRMWFKKSKLFGFDNALDKKIAASNFHLTISKGGRKLIALSKAQVEMSPDQRFIEISHPRITFPDNLKQPDSIRLDNQKMTVSIRNGESETVWDLEKM